MSGKLKLLLQSWDKKDTDFLRDIYDQYSCEKDFLKQLVSYLVHLETESAASWLIKNYYAKNDELSEFSNKIYQSLQTLEHWDAQLHILQIVDKLPISSKMKKTVEITLRKLLVSENKFVRAWSYNGFFILATEHQEYREEVDSFLRMGLEDEPASVKARIRNIVKSKRW